MHRIDTNEGEGIASRIQQLLVVNIPLLHAAACSGISATAYSHGHGKCDLLKVKYEFKYNALQGNKDVESGVYSFFFHLGRIINRSIFCPA